MSKENVKVIDKNYLNNDDRIEQEERELEELKKKLAKEQQPDNKAEEEEEDEDKSVSTKKEEPEEGEGSGFKKRYGDLRRHMQKKESEWKDEKEDLLTRLKALEEQSPPEELEIPKSKKEFNEWRKKYPDVAGFVEEIAKEIAQDMFDSADKKLKEYEEVTSELSRAQAMSKVRKAHKDWDDIIEDEDFHNWIEEQPSFKKYDFYIYDQYEDVEAVVSIVDEYKKDTGKTSSAKKKQEVDAAKSTRTNSRVEVQTQDKVTFKESEVASMSAEDYEKNKDAILDAIRNNKFDYDLSGGAR